MSAAQAANYACAAISLFIVLLRAATTLWQRKKRDTSFALVILSIVFIIARIVVNHYYLSFGTASDVLSGKLTDYDPDLVHAGSILVLVARIILAVILWLQMCILLLFYQHLLSGITVVAYLICATWIVLGATFVGTIFATLLECRPIELYWQISPNPGQCVRAYAQLLLQGISNSVVDVMLLIISFPILSLQKRTLGEHLRLYGLFVLGTFCIVVTILRVVLIFNNGSSQETRSLWASIQIVVSTFVANAPNVYGSLRIARRRKSSGERGGGPGTNSATEIPRRQRQPSCAVPEGRSSSPGLIGSSSAGTDSWLKMDDVELAMNAMMAAPAAYHDQQFERRYPQQQHHHHHNHNHHRPGSLDLDIDPLDRRRHSRQHSSGKLIAAPDLDPESVASGPGEDPTARHSYPSCSSFSVTNPHQEHRQSTSM
ncbi:uncharacterized protein B0I36DRAFT_367369 [Microdochium trichocladiopsis]|uniref:Rhodopsin domain-containing protein n=1 Tax=Microdochium trichocladiopsis TaxID=1682393 RepID=A0A9P9BK73_9PEZI|nr:uncharacterized protein B0I36DRAFT_367369 [Microdochium trichocladiopsis]KAH7020891.1 hypothetical protein B0I36DRAFT_367369 [Microdochium trichocladiopsis]